MQESLKSLHVLFRISYQEAHNIHPFLIADVNFDLEMVLFLCFLLSSLQGDTLGL